MKTKWFLTLFLISILLVSAGASVSRVMAENEQPPAGVETTSQGQAGTTLSAYVTAKAEWIRVYNWSLDKDVTPKEWDLFVGDSGTSRYTITVTKGSPTDTKLIGGEVCVTNGGGVATENLDITINLLGKSGAGPFSPITSTHLDDLGTIAAGQTRCYDYEISYSFQTGWQYKVSAEITITNHSGSLGTPKGPSPDTDFTVPSAPTVYNASIKVLDTNGEEWTFFESGSVSYDKTFTCGESGYYINKAFANLIDVQGEKYSIHDSAKVTIRCYALQVSKTAVTEFDRQYHWDIEKTVKPAELTLSSGQLYDVSYEVTVKTTGYTDGNYRVRGDIVISNPAPMDAELTAVIDTLSSLTLDCQSLTVPALTVPAGGTLTCTYTASLPDGETRTNTATVSLRNYTYDYNKVATPAAGTTSFSGTAVVSFASATMHEIDKCVDVTDNLADRLGTVCVDDAQKTFEYKYTVGPYEACGNYEVNNTAKFTTEDKGLTGSASATVKITVPCAVGCTLTQGYWKTHSSYGPAPYDDNWAKIGENTSFFRSGKSWYQVFWTAPAGNVYYNLAHQYMAARLNILNGADPAEVSAALAQATTLFETYTPAQVAGLKGNAKLTWTSLASLLDQYNNGYIGPGHCSE